MKIEFHYTYLIVAISFILTGYFSNLIVFTSIVLIHEFGHFLMAKINNLHPSKITIYPFGGITQIDCLINTKILKELLVAASGIIFQSIYYLIVNIIYRHGLIRPYIFNEFHTYHYSILFFNLLPIYPLDGAKITGLLLSKFIPYKLSIKLTIIISFITLSILLVVNYYKFNYTTIIIITIIVTNIIKYYQNINYLFNKFLLERYLYKIKYHRYKKINKITNMYKEKNHIIKDKDNYISESEYLKCRFHQKY